MSYTTGTANDLPALLTAITSACVAAGWTLIGSVLTKGAMAMKAEQVTVSGTYGGTGLRFTGGTGQTGGTLTGAGPVGMEIGTASIFALSFPLSYHVFTLAAPDEVYVVVNYNVDRFQYAAWGQSAISLPGTGMWYGASLQNYSGTFPITYGCTHDGGVVAEYSSLIGLFWRQRNWTAQGLPYAETFIHHGLDGLTWSGGTSVNPAPSAMAAAHPMLGMLPNAWNAEAVLLPIHALIPRPSSRMSLVATLGHARYLRLDNYAPGDVITLGAEQWKVFPWLRKNSARRNGGAIAAGATFDSGTLGWAIRYEGA